MRCENKRQPPCSMVHYSNRLITHDMAKLSPVSQNFLSLCFLYLQDAEDAEFIIPSSDVRKSLQLTRKSDSYLKTVVEQTANTIIPGQPLLRCETEKEVLFGMMFYLIAFDKETKSVRLKVCDEFLPLFKRFLNEAFTEYEFSAFIQIKSKYAKNLYRLLRRYHKGCCTLSVEEVRLGMGFSENMASKEVVRIIRKAIENLKQHGLVLDYFVESHYSKNQLESISFKFVFRIKKEKLLNPGKKGLVNENDSREVMPPVMPIQGIPEEQALANAYFEKIGQLKGKDEMDRLAVCLQVHGLLDCLQAIEIAKQNGGRSVAYIEKVLKNGVYNKPKSRGWQMPGIHADLTKKDPDLQEIPF